MAILEETLAPEIVSKGGIVREEFRTLPRNEKIAIVSLLPIYAGSLMLLSDSTEKIGYGLIGLFSAVCYGAIKAHLRDCKRNDQAWVGTNRPFVRGLMYLSLRESEISEVDQFYDKAMGKPNKVLEKYYDLLTPNSFLDRVSFRFNRTRKIRYAAVARVLVGRHLDGLEKELEALEKTLIPQFVPFSNN